MKKTELDKLELQPTLDRVVDSSPWNPPYYSTMPRPEDFGISEGRLSYWESEELSARDKKRMMGRKMFKGTILVTSGVCFIWGLYAGGLIAALAMALVCALFPGLYPLAIIAFLLYEQKDHERLPAKRLQSYYNYKCAISHFRYWQRKQDIDYLRALSGLDFEHAVAVIFGRLGYAATVTKASGDKGIDIFLTVGNKSIPIQCKNHAKSLGPAVVREFIGAMVQGGYSYGVIVASNGFTRGAITEASKANVELLDDSWLRSPRILA